MEHVKALEKISNEYKIIKRFEGGMSNLTFLIVNEKGNKFVYRYSGNNNDIFVNYKTLNHNLKEINILNISSNVVYYNEINEIKICEYIEGEEINAEINFQKIVDVLKKLHNSHVKFSSYEHLSRLIKYEEACNNSGNTEYDILKKKWLEIYEEILKTHMKYPCHGDSQMSNIIINVQDEIKIIDFEFSGTNDYIYDIASFGNVNFEMAIKLLNEYKGKVEKSHLQRLYGWRIFQCLQWYNVALFKSKTGLGASLNIDFEMISIKYLKLSQKLYEAYLKI